MKSFNEILFQNIETSLDGDADYQEWLKKEHKYFDDKKSVLLNNILNKYSSEENFSKKLQLCLPNGINQYYSYEDTEYEALKKEFPL